MMAIKNLTGRGTETKTIQELLCFPAFIGGLQQQQLICLATVNIFLSVTSFLGNCLILVALHRVSFLHPPSKLLYRNLATTDLLVGLVSQPLSATYWISLVYEHWSLCQYANSAAYITSYALCSVSLMTMTAISVDRLLALLIGLRYKQIVTLRHTGIILIIFWVLSIVAVLLYAVEYRITEWYGRIVIPSCQVISFLSYMKIFCTLRQYHAQILDHVQQEPSQPNALNIARYRKAVCSALWVQLALVACYLPYGVVEIVINHSKAYSLHLVIVRGVAVVLVHFNSTLNPFLYCWKIGEVRQAVKLTIRQALCILWS